MELCPGWSTNQPAIDGQVVVKGGSARECMALCHLPRGHDPKTKCAYFAFQAPHHAGELSTCTIYDQSHPMTSQHVFHKAEVSSPCFPTRSFQKLLNAHHMTL